jgi:hypothetical protein
MKKNKLILIIIFLALVITLLIKEKHQYKITILDERFLVYPSKNGIEFGGISDIAYDARNHKLYLIGDRSTFFILDTTFNNDKKMGEMRYLSAHKILRDKRQKDFYNLATYDSEGLTVTSDHKILISHERVAGVIEISPTAEIIKSYRLPKKLQKKENYRDRNKMLESVAYHKRYGVLIASEYPLKKDKMREQTVYSLNGEEWHFKTEKHKNCGITAIEVMDDGNLLVLERAYSGYMNPIRMILKKVYLDSCDKERNCKSEYLASFNSLKGDGFNNFEGLTRVSKNRYLMVSDNDGYQLLPTKLIYFELTTPAPLRDEVIKIY